MVHCAHCYRIANGLRQRKVIEGKSTSCRHGANGYISRLYFITHNSRSFQLYNVSKYLCGFNCLKLFAELTFTIAVKTFVAVA